MAQTTSASSTRKHTHTHTTTTNGNIETVRKSALSGRCTNIPNTEKDLGEQQQNITEKQQEERKKKETKKGRTKVK